MRRFETAKLAVAVFVVSEAVFFAFLIFAYVYYHGSAQGPGAQNSLDPARTLLFTLCLLASSGTVWLAERRRAAARHTQFRFWLGLTICLGVLFLIGQALEYTGLIARSITPERNLFAASFFTLTGFHGFHVLCGLCALAIALVTASAPGARTESGLGAISIYWHFVDVVWIVIYSIVYLTVWL